MNRLSDTHTAVLQLLAECGWGSQSALGLTGYSYTYRTRALKRLDQQYIQKQDDGRTKAYALSTKGRNHLAALNACRFRAEVMEQLRRLARNPDDRAAPILGNDFTAFRTSKSASFCGSLLSYPPKEKIW